MKAFPLRIAILAVMISVMAIPARAQPQPQVLYGEDLDGNGAVDQGETDPNDPSSVPAVVPTANIDEDGDGLTNGEEWEARSHPLFIDSDFDGVSDYDEIHVYGTAPNNPDSDFDSLPDGLELSLTVTEFPGSPGKNSYNEAWYDDQYTGALPTFFAHPTRSTFAEDIPSFQPCDLQPLRMQVSDPLRPDSNHDGLLDAEQINCSTGIIGSPLTGIVRHPETRLPVDLDYNMIFQIDEEEMELTNNWFFSAIFTVSWGIEEAEPVVKVDPPIAAEIYKYDQRTEEHRYTRRIRVLVQPSLNLPGSVVLLDGATKEEIQRYPAVAPFAFCNNYPELCDLAPTAIATSEWYNKFDLDSDHSDFTSYPSFKLEGPQSSQKGRFDAEESIAFMLANVIIEWHPKRLLLSLAAQAGYATIEFTFWNIYGPLAYYNTMLDRLRNRQLIDPRLPPFPGEVLESAAFQAACIDFYRAASNMGSGLFTAKISTLWDKYRWDLAAIAYGPKMYAIMFLDIGFQYADGRWGSFLPTSEQITGFVSSANVNPIFFEENLRADSKNRKSGDEFAEWVAWYIREFGSLADPRAYEEFVGGAFDAGVGPFREYKTCCGLKATKIVWGNDHGIDVMTWRSGPKGPELVIAEVKSWPKAKLPESSVTGLVQGEPNWILRSYMQNIASGRIERLVRPPVAPPASAGVYAAAYHDTINALRAYNSWIEKSPEFRTLAGSGDALKRARVTAKNLGHMGKPSGHDFFYKHFLSSHPHYKESIALLINEGMHIHAVSPSIAKKARHESYNKRDAKGKGPTRHFFSSAEATTEDATVEGRRKLCIKALGESSSVDKSDDLLRFTVSTLGKVR